MNKRLISALGAAAVVIGVFSPLISIPFAGSISYANQLPGEGIILIGLVAVSLLFSFADVYWPSFVIPFLSLQRSCLRLSISVRRWGR
jgi:hypothetical protein